MITFEGEALGFVGSDSRLGNLHLLNIILCWCKGANEFYHLFVFPSFTSSYDSKNTVT